ncbi:MAG: BON domain-containing protein [Planctomycetes bacterium]|nr:BON domain-containing protein [Planctomycetota bacterium]
MELRSVFDVPVPLATSIESVVREKTNGMVRELRVTVIPGEVVLTGRAASYYAKQLATHAALSFCDELTLTNDLEVL